MRKTKTLLIVFLWILLLLPIYSAQENKEAAKKPRPLEDINDILTWKDIRIPVISNDGQWFAYRLFPIEGDTEVVIRETKGKKEYRFPTGEAPRVFYISGRELKDAISTDIFVSDDSKWVAYTIYPGKEEAKKLKKQKKKIYHKIGLMNLNSGESTEFGKVKKFAFSGENSSWIAIHKYPLENQEQEKKKWKGSDLILLELTTSKQFNIGNVSEFAFDKKGQWLAWIIDAQEKSGNGVQLRNMSTGAIFSLESDKAVYEKLTWTEKGDGLAVLKGIEDENYEDKLYSLVGFNQFSSDAPKKVSYDPKADKNFPKGMTISPNRNPLWTDDFAGILLGIHEVKKKEKENKKENKEIKETAEKKEEKEEKKLEKKEPDKEKPTNEEEIDKEDLPELVIWHWLDKRLQSMQQIQEKRDKNFSYLSIYRIDEKKFIRLADEKLRQVITAPKHTWALGFDNSEYELVGNLDGRNYQDIYVINLTTGARSLPLKKCRWYFSPSPDGTHFLYYDAGHFFTYEMATGTKYNITKYIPTSFINEEDDHNVINPPIRQPGLIWTKDGKSLLLYDNWDVWNIPVQGGEGINLTVDGKTEGIRYRSRIQLDPEEKGIDLAGPLYFSAYGEWTKKSGVVRIDEGKPGANSLLWDDAVFSLLKAKKADVYLYTKQTAKDFPDYYVTDSSLRKGLKITEANPQQKNYFWSDESILLDYKSDKGDKLQASLFLPANYEKGKSYPTIVYIYEKLSQGLNRYYSPEAHGFNKSIYTSRGYAVLMPDIVYKINDPGMSAVWCVLPAIEAAIETGVVDKSRIGIHGHSWGGYQTSFLITQSDIFRAAVASTPLTNMISMYSSIYWNTGSANQPIFESSQGRFTGGYWDNLEAYTRNSPVHFAQNVKTPLLLVHCDNDGAVDWNQGIEYFNTLRRMEKPVVLLQYKGENHNLRQPSNRKDYAVRMREFFDHHLLGKPAPEWLEQGISHLKHEEHLKKRTKAIIKRKSRKEN